MSGLEIFAVVGVVASIVSAFADGQKVLKVFKEKRRAKKEQRSKDAKTEEDGLQVSLKTGEDKIREQYNHDALQLGQKFAIGDQDALEALNAIKDDLFLVKQHLRARVDGRVDPMLLPIHAMNNMSEQARDKTIRILFDLAQRLSNTSSAASVSRSRFRAAAPHAVLSLEIGLPTNLYGSPSHTQEPNSHFLIIPGQSDNYQVPWLTESLRASRVTPTYGAQQQSILESMQRATLTNTGNNSMPRSSPRMPPLIEGASTSRSDQYISQTQRPWNQSRQMSHDHVEEAHPGDRRIDLPTPESSHRSSFSDYRGIPGPSRLIHGSKASLASQERSKGDMRSRNAAYDFARSSSFDMDSIFPNHDSDQRGKDHYYDDSTDGESQGEANYNDEEGQDGEERVRDRGKRPLTYVSSHQDELENDIYEFFEAKPQPLRISKSPSSPLADLSISPKEDKGKRPIYAEDFPVPSPSQLPQSPADRLQIEDFPLPPGSQLPKSSADRISVDASPLPESVNVKESSSKLMGTLRKLSWVPNSPSDTKKGISKSPNASSLASRINSEVKIADGHLSSISSGEGNANLSPVVQNTEISPALRLSRMGSTTTSGSSDAPVGAEHEANPLKSQDESMRTPLEIIAPVNFQPGRPYLPSDENNYAGYCKGAWHLQMRNRKKAYESCVRPRGISSSVGFYKCRYCNFEMRMVTDAKTKKGCIDPKFYDTHGLWYRHEFLFRSHIPCKGLNLDPKTSLKLGCMFCTAEGLGTKVFENVAKFMAHLQTHRCENALPKGETLLHNMNAVVGRGPKAGDPYDVFFPPLESP